jgi:CheY-like chemotaxis protein
VDEAPPPIFLIEDDPFDVELLTHELATLEPSCPIVVCDDGAQALRELAVYCDAPEPGKMRVPRAIFIDLNLPRMSGFAVIEWIRQQRRLANVPIAAVSGSESMEDVTRAYSCGADEFVRKPADAVVLRHVLRSFQRDTPK